jgi:hypothetical protein
VWLRVRAKRQLGRRRPQPKSTCLRWSEGERSLTEIARSCAETVGAINPPLTTIVRATRTQFQAHSAIGTIQIVVLAHRECRMTGVKQT